MVVVLSLDCLLPIVIKEQRKSVIKNVINILNLKNISLKDIFQCQKHCEQCTKMPGIVHTAFPSTLKRISRKHFEKNFQSHLKSLFFEGNYHGKWSAAKTFFLFCLGMMQCFSEDKQNITQINETDIIEKSIFCMVMHTAV